MAFLAVMPLVYLLDSSLYKTGVTFPEYMWGGFALLWMIAIGYLAYNMFRPEEKDKAVEYILSLPISRWKLLIWKTVPRIAVLLLANVIAKCLGVGYSWFWSFTGLLSFIVFSQVCGFALGIVGRKSWITRLMLFVMTICAFIINSIPPEFIWKEFIKPSSLLPYPSPIMSWMEHVRFSQLPYILVEIGFLALILVPLYRNWDLKPTRTRELSFAKRSLIPMIVLAFPVVWMFSS